MPSSSIRSAPKTALRNPFNIYIVVDFQPRKMDGDKMPISHYQVTRSLNYGMVIEDVDNRPDKQADGLICMSAPII